MDRRSPTSAELWTATFAWSALGLGIAAVLAFALWQSGVALPGFPAERVGTADLHEPRSQDLQRAWALLGGGAGTRVAELDDAPDRLAEAEALIDRASTESPSSPEVHRLRGVLHLARGELDAAEASLERALERQSDHYLSLLTLGAVQVQAGDYASGERTFRRALDQHPESVEALHNLGQTLWLLDRKDEALEVYRRKIAIMQQSEARLPEQPAEPVGPGG